MRAVCACVGSPRNGPGAPPNGLGRGGAGLAVEVGCGTCMRSIVAIVRASPRPRNAGGALLSSSRHGPPVCEYSEF